MQVYTAMDQRMPLARVAAHAQRAEALGFDGLNVPDGVHDGFLVAHEALRATSRLKVATSVLVAFPRSPMTVAIASWDLQSHSRGRFELGLGSQVRGNIVGRYSTSWSAPVPRMREYIQALRAIFASFQHGVPLRFGGDHYQFDRLQPFFDPGPLEHPPPPIFLGAIGSRMTALAGEVADGHVSHSTHSSRLVLGEWTSPALDRGAARSGRAPEAFARTAAGLVSVARDVAGLAREREKNRALLGFLFSTPAYWRALELHDRAAVGPQLRTLAQTGRWSDMANAIDDELLDALVPSGTYAEIVDCLRKRCRDLATHVTFPMPDDPADEPSVRAIVEALRS